MARNKQFVHRNRGPHSGYRNFYQSSPRPPFDIYLVEDFFPKSGPSSEIDNELQAAIIKRHAELSPPPEEQTNLSNLVSNVNTVLDNLVLCPGSFDACQIEEVRFVGSFKKGTMLTGRNMADLVLVLKTLPVLEAIKSLGTKMAEEIDSISGKAHRIEYTEGGFDIYCVSNEAAVRCLITTNFPNLRKLDPTIHLSAKSVQKHLLAIQHSRWFEESANQPPVKVLIRILRDVCSRFDGFSALSPWMIDVLAHYSVTYRKSQQLLPAYAAFKRVLQLLAGGLFLPGSTSILDPCENPQPLHSGLTLMQEDAICMTAQTLLRILCYGDGYKVILGLEPDTIGITTQMSEWDGVVVAPSNPAFELPPRMEESETDLNDSSTDVRPNPVSPTPA